MRAVRVALGVVVVAGLLVCSVASGAPGTPAGGPIKIYVAGPNALRSRVVVIGAIGDHGTAISQDKNGKPDIDGSFEKFRLTHGGFTLDDSHLAKGFEKVRPKVNRDTCSVEFAGSGPGTLINGTGLYAGIGGKLKITIDSATIAPRTNGKCNLNDNAKPVAEYDTVSVSGTVTFS